jgi:hypothetical protein
LSRQSYIGSRGYFNTLGSHRESSGR